MLCEGECFLAGKSLPKVLILVLMEDALREETFNLLFPDMPVLILVLMEDALRDYPFYFFNFARMS